jgi:hypothetical protein
VHATGEKEFRFRKYRVMVPRSLLTKWAATSVEETCKIIESVTAVWAVANAEWKQAKFKPTLEGIRAVFDLLPSRTEPLTKTVEKLANPELKTRVLWLLKFERYRALNRPPMAKLFLQAVIMAAADGDERFFKALGERLKDKPVPFKAPSKSTALSRLLREQWIVKNGLCLCWFSDPALTDFLKKTHGAYTPDAVRKTRERMRLRKLRRPLVRSIATDGNSIHLRQ